MADGPSATCAEQGGAATSPASHDPDGGRDQHQAEGKAMFASPALGSTKNGLRIFFRGHEVAYFHDQGDVND